MKVGSRKPMVCKPCDLQITLNPFSSLSLSLEAYQDL